MTCITFSNFRECGDTNLCTQEGENASLYGVDKEGSYGNTSDIFLPVINSNGEYCVAEDVVLLILIRTNSKPP